MIVEKKYLVIGSTPEVLLDSISECSDYVNNNLSVGESIQFQEVYKYTKE